ncbi:MAG: MlaD family protein [Planctomycetota bacterium]
MLGRNQNLAVGFFVILAMSAAMALVILFGESDILKSTYRVSTLLNTIGGPVNKGAPVRLMGIPVGRVHSVDFDSEKQGVKILIDINQSVVLLTDSWLKVEQDGVVGDRFLQIYPGSKGTVLKEGDVMRGESPVSFGETIENARNSMQKLDKVIDSLHESLNHINGIVGSDTFREDIHGSAREIHGSARELTHLLQETRSLVSVDASRLLTDLQTTNARLQGILGSIKTAAVTADDVIRDVNRGRGTLGRLIKDEDAIDSLISTLHGLDAMVRELNDDPSTVVWGRKPKPGAALPLSDVEALVASGLSERVVVAQIRSCGQHYDLDAPAILELRRKGIPDLVIEALVRSGR